MGLTMPYEQEEPETQTQTPQEQPEGAPQQQQQQQQQQPTYIRRLAAHVSSHLDLDLLLQVAADVRPPAVNDGSTGVPRVLRAPAMCKIAVARDQAFCFFYQVPLQ
jgi:cobyrinic acid a,c-diamide synthase